MTKIELTFELQYFQVESNYNKTMIDPLAKKKKNCVKLRESFLIYFIDDRMSEKHVFSFFA